MGLLKLLTFPLSGPLAVARVVRDEAERQLYDVAAIRQQLADLERRRQLGQADEDTLDREEEALLQRLLDARAYHRARDGGGPPGS
jgi:hypothetical protein